MAAKRHPLTDQVLVILKRAWPGEVEKEDLIEQAGLSPGDLNEVLGQLKRDGEIDESGEHFAWLNPEDPDRDAASAAAEPAPGDKEEPTAEGRLDLPDHAGRRVQVSFALTGSFVPSRGQSDEGLARQAAKLAEEIGNVLGVALPSLGANAIVSKVEVYDRPRLIFDGEGVVAPGEEPK